MPLIFFSENVTAITMTFTHTIHTPFAIMRLFFYKISAIFKALLPTFSKALYTNATKFPASTSERMTSCTRDFKQTATTHP
jgi:hypothetical protein